MSVTLTSTPSHDADIADNAKRNALMQLSIIIIIISTIGGLIGTLISVVLIFIFNKIENRSWNSIGFKQQESWKRLIILAVVISLIIQFFMAIASVIVYLIFLERPNLSILGSIEGNVGLFLQNLLIGWTIAAFGEEIIWRGFFMNIVALLFDNSRFGWSIAVVLSGIAFGSIHLYQGLVGAILIALAGMIFAVIFLRSKQNLWLCILIHGFMDTLGFTLLFLGIL